MLKRAMAVLLSIVIMIVAFSACDQSGSDGSSDGNYNNSNSNNNVEANKPLSIEKTVNKLFPTFKPARQIYSVDISELDASSVVLLRQLQGLVAKTKSADIYLISNDADRFWLNYLCDELGAYYTEITVEQIIALYSDAVKTIVLYTPETFEFYSAWNDAARREDAVCVDFSVAVKYELFENKEVIDIRNIFTDEKTAYEDLFGMIELDEQSTFVSLTEDSAFLDYATAIDAYMLPVSDDDWSLQFVCNILSKTDKTTPGVVFTDYVTDEYVTKFSSFGFGAIAVAGFANSTAFSSISIDYTAEKEKVQNISAKKGNIYISLLISSQSAGDVINNGYRVCKAKRNDYHVAFEYPMFLSRVAPATLLWYSLNTKQNGDALVPDGDWSVIDQSVIDDDLYKLWFDINNYFINKCGMRVNVTDSIREDNEYLKYTDLTKSDGVLLKSNIPASGVYNKPDSKPVVIYNELSVLTELETNLNNLVTDNLNPIYYVYAITCEQYFEKIPIYDDYNESGVPDGYYSITEIIALALSDSDAINFILPAQMMTHIIKHL